MDLFFFIPGKQIKHKNDSENLYLIMSSMARNQASSLQRLKDPVQTERTKKQNEIVERFWQKLQAKFKKIGDMFRFFDRNFDNEISFKEFRIVAEELDMRFTSAEMRALFDFLDSEKTGTIGYNEFTQLCDEKRRGLDPFINKNQRAALKDKDIIN